MTEAFVYLWYDAPNKMYYLGSHKGSPEDSYTHSSTKWESFTKDNIPEGVTRRILAYGTHEEMLALESKLQANRKERCWDRYYNEVVCDGVYGGFGLGENNPMYGKGAERTGENSPNWKGGVYANDPVAYMREYDKKRSATPERKAYMKEYRQAPEYKEQRKQYRQTPEYKEQKKQYNNKYRAKIRTERQAEKQGVGTLDVFLK